MKSLPGLSILLNFSPMKRILLITLLVLSATKGFSNKFIYLWGGAGIATHNNYDMGLSYGTTFVTALFNRVGVGGSVFSQQYNLYYDKELPAITGATVRHKSSYLFVSPMVQFHLGNKVGSTHFYLTGGVGFKVGVKDTLRKFYTATFPSTTNYSYDSLIDKSANINNMVTRIGFGFTEHFPVSKKFGICFSEDVGFLPSLISSTKVAGDTKFNNNVNQLFRPTYISLRIGIYLR